MKTLRPTITMSKPALATNSASTRRTRGTTWQAIRWRILARDCGLCQPCKLAGRTTEATEVDHIAPLEIGGTDAEANLQSICQDCHKAKTARERLSLRLPR
jgi:5-methylcytosine-specific restriction protein A